MPEFNFKLTPKQYRLIFELDDIDEVLYGGQAGGGKSEGLLLFALYRRLKYPGSIGLMLRRTSPELEKSLIRKSRKYYPPFAKFNDSKKWWIFNNGSIQEFGYCQYEKDVYQYQSAEYDDISFDELTHFTEFQYLYLHSRIRPQTDARGLIRTASNPGNIGHEWVKARFVIPARETIHRVRDTEGRIKTFFFLPATLADNTLMSVSEREAYSTWLDSLPEREREQLKQGSWDVKQDDTLIPIYAVEDAVNRQIISQSQNLVIAMDVARFGDDKTVLMARLGATLVGIEEHTKTDLMEICGLAIDFLKRHANGNDIKKVPFKVDVCGLGAGVADRLIELGYNIISINSAEQALDTEKFPNKRSEMWFALRSRFIDGNISIFGDRELIAEVCSPKYKFDSQGRMQIEKKEDIKKRLGRSPDKADTLVYLYAPNDPLPGFFVAGRGQKEHETVR